MEIATVIFTGLISVVAVTLYLLVFSVCRYFGDDLTWRAWAANVARDHVVIAAVLATLYGIGTMVKAVIA